ncbi:hypothetical protein C1H76_5206 [Elsinoe australis]|uniref:Uncharacterized protein n=1 Tax=Elsinoe australis TaxID=40998 RepID=A0A4U7B2X9_9PEZI|nr:hypothetical protein C1H76_5206 [Elsinoe australis]
MTVPLAQRIVSSATGLSKQAFTGSQMVHEDLGQLQSSGKASFLEHGARHRPSNDLAGSSSQRRRRALYKGEDDQLRSMRKELRHEIGVDQENDWVTLTPAKSNYSTDLGFDQRHRHNSTSYDIAGESTTKRAQSTEEDLHPQFDSTWERLYPGQVLRDFTVGEDHKDLDMMIKEYARFADTWKLLLSPQSGHGFTYTWNRSGTTSAKCPTGSGSKTYAQALQSSSDKARSKAAARAEQISAHLLHTQHDRLYENRAKPSLEECSFLRQQAEDQIREERAIRQADLARLHGTRNFSHQVPIRSTGQWKQRPMMKTAEVHLQNPTRLENMAPASLKGEQKEEISKSDFQCPFPHCHHALKTGAYWVRKWENPSDLSTLELARSGSQGLMCVHDGCLECFVDGSEWWEHIMSSHHGNGSDKSRSLTERMMRVWGKRRAVI